MPVGMLCIDADHIALHRYRATQKPQNLQHIGHVAQNRAAFQHDLLFRHNAGRQNRQNRVLRAVDRQAP